MSSNGCHEAEIWGQQEQETKKIGIRCFVLVTMCKSELFQERISRQEVYFQ